MRLLFARGAVRDLTRLRDFIARDNPRAAAFQGKRLRRLIGLLRTHPAMGHVVEGLSDVRDLVAGDYVVRYTGRDERIVVLRIWHGREDR